MARIFRISIESIEEKMILEKKRIDFLDLLKCFALFCMIFYHGLLDTFHYPLDGASVQNCVYYILMGISSCCVPIFFLVNGGLLLNRKMILKMHMQKIVHLLAIFAVWDFLDVWITSWYTGKRLSAKELGKTLWNMTSGWNNHLWFLMALAVLYLLFPIIKNAYDTDQKICIYFLAVTFILSIGNKTLNIGADVAGSFIGRQIVPEGFNFFHDLNFLSNIRGYSIVYFILGGYLTAHREKLLRTSRKKYGILFAVSLLLLIIWGEIRTAFQGSVYDIVWGGYDTIFTVGITISLFGLALTYKYRDRLWQKGIRIISKNSLGIYLCQTLVLRITGGAVKKYINPGNMLMFLLYLFCVMILCLLISIFMRKIPLVNKLVSL